MRKLPTGQRQKIRLPVRYKNEKQCVDGYGYASRVTDRFLLPAFDSGVTCAITTYYKLGADQPALPGNEQEVCLNEITHLAYWG